MADDALRWLTVEDGVAHAVHEEATGWAQTERSGALEFYCNEEDGNEYFVTPDNGVHCRVCTEKTGTHPTERTGDKAYDVLLAAHRAADELDQIDAGAWVRLGGVSLGGAVRHEVHEAWGIEFPNLAECPACQFLAQEHEDGLKTDD